MDNMRAFARGKANRGKEPMVFDWDKAAKLIKESGAEDVSAGLRNDWEYTGGNIFADGKPVKEDDTYVYLASTWATPELEIGGITVDCFIMKSESPNGKWDSGTYWPQSALDILTE